MSEKCDPNCDMRAGLLDCVDEILGVRDCLGLNLADCYIVTRTWTGERPGDGTFTDVSTQILPSPSVADYSHNVRTTEASTVKSGDLILGNISRNKFPDELVLRTDTLLQNVEKFIKVGRHYYRTIHIKEELLTWAVHVRKILMDETEEVANG